MSNAREIARENFRYILDSNELSVSEAFCLFDFSKDKIRNYLNGCMLIDLEDAKKIADFQGVSLYEFFHEDISRFD